MKTGALIGASDFNESRFREMNDAGAFDVVIAVDGGYEYLNEIGVVPDLVMGDFDSLGYEPKKIRHVKFPPHKDKSDMELAISRAKMLGCEALYVFGALGQRLDHTIANLSIFAKACEDGLSVCLVDIDNAVFFVTGPDTFEADARESGIVSVFSATDVSTGVFERGMEWDLDDVELDNRTSRGLSNQLIGEPVMIGVESGTIMIFFPL